jgi:hypothetical protein
VFSFEYHLEEVQKTLNIFEDNVRYGPISVWKKSLSKYPIYSLGTELALLDSEWENVERKYFDIQMGYMEFNGVYHYSCNLYSMT